jgi:hypothetical protein
MPDVLEQHLATHLRTLGETVDDELPPPVDLELRVLRRRRSVRAKRRWSSVSIAAAVVVAVATVAVVHGTAGRGSIRIATSPTTAVPVHDSLQPGTVMLSARGRFVITLDAAGHTNATMVAAEHGDITYARATDDHRALWYLSLKKGSKACGDVVRADIDGRASKIITHAVAFDVSPDGSRLALYGAGDLAHDRCSPVRAGLQGRLVVLDLASGSASPALAVGALDGLRWSPDGSYLVSVSCSSKTCFGYDVVDVPATPGAALVPESGALSGYPARLVHSARIVFGPGGLYTLETSTPFPGRPTPSGETVRIERIDPRSSRSAALVFSGGTAWEISQVVPTSVGTYVVAAPKGAKSPRAAASSLYRIVAGKLVLVRSLADPGTLTPVAPITSS